MQTTGSVMKVANTKWIYIAGPFRGTNSWEIESNIRRAEELALEVWRMNLGAGAFCPHTNTRFFQGAAPDEVWLDALLNMVSRCDALLTTRDYERSSGAVAEVAEARRLGIKVCFNLGELREWLSVLRKKQA